MKIKWLLPIILLFANSLLVAINYAVSTEYQFQRILEDTEARLARTIVRLQLTLEHANKHDESEFIQKTISSIGSDPTFKQVILVNEAETIVASTQVALIENHFSIAFDSLPQTEIHKITTQIAAARSSMTDIVIEINDAAEIVGIIPVSFGRSANSLRDDRIGFLVARMELSPVFAIARERARKEAAIFLVELLVVTGALVVLLHQLLSRRLVKLMETTRAIAQGDLSAKTKITGRDEIQDLASSIDRMTQQLNEGIEKNKAELIQRRQAEEQVKQLNIALEENLAQLSDANHSLEQKARELEKISTYKSEFLANMSHELRTPLNSIIGFTQILRRRYSDAFDERAMDAIDTVHNNGKHLLSLINDVLDFSKVEAGKMELNISRVDLVILFKELESTFAPIAEERALKFQVAELPITELVADQQRIRQVLINLLSNAFKFTREGSVSVDFESPEKAGLKYLKINIHDTGSGITEKNMTKLFNHFEQLDNTETNVTPGTGLGLVLVKQMTELHEGYVEVKSKVQEGSTFSVAFPLTK